MGLNNNKEGKGKDQDTCSKSDLSAAGDLTTATAEETKWALSEGLRSGLKLTFLWVAYVILGSVTFIYLEQSIEVKSLRREHEAWAKFKEMAKAGNPTKLMLVIKPELQLLCPHPALNTTFVFLEEMCGTDLLSHQDCQKMVFGGDWLKWVEDACGTNLVKLEKETSDNVMSMADAVYYIMTLVTTIGYGHIVPSTANSRLFCILYSLVGVPLTCMLLANSTEMLSKRMLLIYTTARKRHHFLNPKTLLYLITWIYLILGFIVFMFLPSVALSELEGWAYEEALYYTFITLSTIGFGEYVAGYREDQEYKGLYKMIIVTWIMAALGYWFLLLNFLQKALEINVPRNIKRTFTMSKRFAMQAEFIRQLARHGHRQTSHRPGDRGVVALAVAVAGVLLWEPPGLSNPRIPHLNSRAGSVVVPLKKERRMTLSDLLNVCVVLRSDTVPALRSIVQQTGTPGDTYSKTLHDFVMGTNTEEGKDEHESLLQNKGVLNVNQGKENGLFHAKIQGEGQEISLPLREVLHLVSLVSEVEGQMETNKQSESEDYPLNANFWRGLQGGLAASEDSPVNSPVCLNPCRGPRLKRSISRKDEDTIIDVLNDVYPASDAEEDSSTGM